MPNVSVIMCVYNGENVIEKSIKSILNQSYNDIELIVINDGSTDGTKDVIEALAKEDSRIIVFNNENGGPGKARNTGINAATGKYMMFIDADDMYEENMIEFMYDEIEKGNYDLVTCSYKNVYFNNNDIVKTKDANCNEVIHNTREELLRHIDEFLASGMFNPLWNKIYKSNIIKENKLNIIEDSFMGEDYCFNLDYIDKCKSVAIFNKALYRYNINDAGLTGKFRENEFELRKPNLKRLEKFYDENKLDKNRLHFEYIMMCYSCFSHLFNSNNPKTYKENKECISEVLNSDEVREALSSFKSTGIVQKIAFGVLKSKLINIIYITSYILYKVVKR